MRRLNLTFSFILWTVSAGVGQTDTDATLQRAAEQLKNQPIHVSTFRVPRRNIAKVKMPKELKEKLSISESDKETYQNGAEGAKIEILKLWNNQCAHLKKIVDVEKDRDCLVVSEYFVGASYSFANKSYYKQNDVSHLNAVIDLVDNRFWTANINFPMRVFNGNMTQILTDLGEKELETVTRDSSEVKNLLRLELFNDKGISVWKQNLADYQSQGVKIADNLPATLKHTYLLRSIFYDRHQLNPGYKETVYAFQLVKFENNIATILWKRISSRRL